MDRVVRVALVAVVLLGCERQRTEAPKPDFARLPAETEMVVGADWKRVRSSPLWQKFRNVLVDERLVQLQAACNLDIYGTITRVTIGFSGFGDEASDATTTFVVHGVKKQPVMACLDKYAKDVSLTRDGEIYLLRTAFRGAIGFTWIAEDEAVVVAGKTDVAAVRAAARGDSELARNPELAASYAMVSRDASVYAILQPGAKALSGFGGSAKSAAAQLTFGDGVVVDGWLRVIESDKATELAQRIERLAEPLRAQVDKLEITPQGTMVHAVLTVSAAKLEALVARLGAK